MSVIVRLGAGSGRQQENIAAESGAPSPGSYTGARCLYIAFRNISRSASAHAAARRRSEI
jgi:hypothetical protein